MLVICPEYSTLDTSRFRVHRPVVSPEIFFGAFTNWLQAIVSKSESQSCDRPRFGDLLNANDFVSIRKIYNFYEQIFRRVDLPYCAANVFYRHQSDK